MTQDESNHDKTALADRAELSDADVPSPWRIIAASVCGTSHQKRSQPCQDAHHWYRSGDLSIAAVADGAGSASQSDIGAKIAVEVAVQTLRDRLEAQDPPELGDSLLTEALDRARDAVKTHAKEQQVSVREFASTLIAIVATPERVGAAQIGDGAAIAGDRHGNLISLTLPEAGEYLNETTFLVSPKAVEKAQIHFWQGRPVHLAMFSDGLQLLALSMPQATPHAPFFSPLFQFVAQTSDEDDAIEQLRAFLRSPRVTERTDDDLTLLLAYCDRAEPESIPTD
jgi:hypothetical protein